MEKEFSQASPPECFNRGYSFRLLPGFPMAQFGDGTVGAEHEIRFFPLLPQTAYLAGMPLACYCFYMANIQVKNIPEKLHNRLRRYARQQDCTLGEIILEAIEREVARREWHKRFSGRAMTHLNNSAAELLEQERRQRDRDLP